MIALGACDLWDAAFAAAKWIGALLGDARFWGGLGVGAVLVLVGLWLLRRRQYQLSSFSMSLPFGLGSATFDSSHQDRVLAWKMYVQLKTRKAALPFDTEHDVIAEVYDSFYELFGITRGLLTEMSVRGIEGRDGVADLLLRVLNDGIRPHVTRWQAPYRRWWEQQLRIDENAGKSPQAIQRLFPNYAALVDDLMRTNTELAKLAEDLLSIAKPCKKRAASASPLAKHIAAIPPSTGPDVSTTAAPPSPHDVAETETVPQTSYDGAKAAPVPGSVSPKEPSA